MRRSEAVCHRLHAEHVFGAEHVAHQINVRQRKSRTTSMPLAASSVPLAASMPVAAPAPVEASVRLAAGAPSLVATPAPGVAPSSVVPPAPVARRGGRGGARVANPDLAVRPVPSTASYDLAARGLVNMGFREAQVRHALLTIDARHVNAGAIPIEAMLREALAILT